MKKSILAGILLLILNQVSFSSFSQSDGSDSVATDFAEKLNEIFNSEVKLDIDRELFSQKEGNMYMNQEGSAMIMCLVAPQSFAKAKEQHENRDADEEVDIIDEGEFEENGKKVLFRTGNMEREGRKFILEQYVVAATEKQTIIITGFYETKIKSTYENVVRKAAVTARLD